MNVKLGWIKVAGLGLVYIGEYDGESMTARVLAGGKFVNLKWNGAAWVLI